MSETGIVLRKEGRDPQGGQIWAFEEYRIERVYKDKKPDGYRIKRNESQVASVPTFKAARDWVERNTNRG